MLLMEYQAAASESVRCISWGDGIEQTCTSLAAAGESIADAGAIMMPGLVDDLPALLKSSGTHTVSNSTCGI